MYCRKIVSTRKIISSDQNKNFSSFVVWSAQDNFFINMFLFMYLTRGNLPKSFLKIAIYFIFPYLIPYKISHVYLPEISVRMTYLSDPRKTKNTPIFTSMYPWSMPEEWICAFYFHVVKKLLPFVCLDIISSSMKIVLWSCYIINFITILLSC